MKLTIKDKQEQEYSKNELTSKSKSFNHKLLESPCCNAVNEGQRHVFLRPPTKQQKLLYDLIKIDSQCIYSKVSPVVKTQDLQSCIARTLRKFKLRYEGWIGYLCSHCCHHYKSEGERMDIIGLFVDKFRAAFEEKQCAGSILDQTMKRAKKYCTDSPLVPSDACFSSIFTRYQKTLLLEFLPAKYSEYIIKRYLANDGDIEEYVRLCTSLAHFVLNTVNPVKEAHFVDLMHRPFMGTVEWPIIIANRHIFQLEPVNTPLIQSL